MTPEEITDLASECANANQKIADLKTPYFREYEKAYEDMLRFLLRRYVLVEKSKVEEEYHEANICRTHVERYGAQWGALTAKMALMERLFPEIAKEVEG